MSISGLLKSLYRKNPVSKPRVLFILKQRQDSGGWCSQTSFPTSNGLYNSASFISDLLKSLGYETNLVQVVDSNEIDRVVHDFRPTHVVLEAIWSVPTKFRELIRLYPLVHWIVRIHSEIPFIANEGMSIEWLTEYVKYDRVYIAANSERMLEELRLIVRKAYPSWKHDMVNQKVAYLPNYYPITYHDINLRKSSDKFFDVGCFGAIRPMKNQLIQAVAAIDAAHMLNKKLRFHVNGTRIEQGGENILKNLSVLLSKTGNELVIEPWVDHNQFLDVLGRMDLGMQVSFSETFNIVAADTVMADLPIVVSPEVRWACNWAQADPNSSKDITKTMMRVIDWKWNCIIRTLNVHGLKAEAWKAKEFWLFWLGEIDCCRRHFGY